MLKYFSLSHPYSKLNLLICWFCGISCQSYDAFIVWWEGGAEKRILVGAGEQGKETDKRINERKKLMTNDRLSWIKQSPKSQISNFKSLFLFICGSFYPYIIPFFSVWSIIFPLCFQERYM